MKKVYVMFCGSHPKRERNKIVLVHEYHHVVNRLNLTGDWILWNFPAWKLTEKFHERSAWHPWVSGPENYCESNFVFLKWQCFETPCGKMGRQTRVTSDPSWQETPDSQHFHAQPLPMQPLFSAYRLGRGKNGKNGLIFLTGRKTAIPRKSDG